VEFLPNGVVDASVVSKPGAGFPSSDKKKRGDNEDNPSTPDRITLPIPTTSYQFRQQPKEKQKHQVGQLWMVNRGGNLKEACLSSW